MDEFLFFLIFSVKGSDNPCTLDILSGMQSNRIKPLLYLPDKRNGCKYYGKYYGNGEDTADKQVRPKAAEPAPPDDDDLDELNYLAGVTRKD